MAKYNNPEDITTGVSPLKGVRGSDLYNQDAGDFELGLGLENLRSERRLWEAQTGRSGKNSIGTPGFMESYVIPEDEPGYDYGKSRFDKGMMIAPTESDIANRRAESQTGVGKFLNGVSKGAILAGTTFLDGTLGLAYGIIDAAQAGVQGDKDWYARLWDNSVSNGLQQINQLSEEALPNYRTAQEQERSWFQNLGTVNFWADSFLKNIGFTVGAFYSGGVLNKLLKGAGLVKSGLGAAVTGSIFSAINEGRIEANNNTNDWRDLQLQQIDDEYQRQAQLLYQSGMSDEELAYELNALDNARQKAISDVQDNASSVGLIDLLSNIAILSATNLFTYGRVYAKGFDTAKQQAASMGRKVTKNAQRAAADKALAESEGKEFLSRARKVDGRYDWKEITKGRVLFNGLRTGLREGNEEMAQAMAAEFAGEVYTPDSPETYYRIGLDETAKENTDNLFDAIISSFANTYGNGDRYEEFAVGFLTGLIGMPTVGVRNNASADTYLGNGKKIGLTGGLGGEFARAKEMNAQGRAGVEKMNEFLDKFEQNKMPFYRKNSLSNAMDGWVAQDNKFEYKNAEDNDLFETISQFSKMGKMADLKELIKDGFFNVTDEQLQSIATSFDGNAETAKEGEGNNYRDDNGELLSSTPEGRQIMRNILKNSGESILKDIEAYENSLQYIRNLSGNSADSARTTELAWMHWKLGKFNDRYSSIVNANKDSLDAYVKNAETRIGILDEDIEKRRASIAGMEEGDAKTKAQEELDAVVSEKTMLSDSSDFIKKMLSSPDIQSFLVSMPGKLGEYLTKSAVSFITLMQDGNIAAPSAMMKALDTIADMPAIVGAWNTFNEALTDYMKNPTNLDRMHAKIDEEKAAVSEEKAKKKVVEENRGKSAEELADMPDDLFAELDGLESMPDDLQEEKDKADKIREDATAVTAAADELPEGEREAILDMLQNRTTSEKAALLDPEEELSAEDLASFSIEEDELNALAERIAKDKGLDIPTDEEKFIADLQLREEKARKILEQLRQAVGAGKAESAAMPKSEDNKEPVSSVPALTQEQRQKLEKYAEELGQNLIETAVTPETQEGLRKEVIHFLENVRRWNLTKKDSLWALIHNDDTYKAVVNASEMPGIDEGIIRNFLSDKDIFGEETTTVSGPVESPVQKAAPVKSSSSPLPASPSVSVAAQRPEEKPTGTSPREEVAQGRAGSDEFSPFSYEYFNVGGELVFDNNGQLIQPETIPGYSPQALASEKKRHEYLESVGAFASRYNGVAYDGKPVHFEIRPEANKTVGETVILIVDDAGNVLGDIASSKALSKYPKKREWVEAKEREYQAYVNSRTAAGQPVGIYQLKESTAIKETLAGKTPYVTGTDGSRRMFTLNQIRTVGGQRIPIILTTVNRLTGRFVELGKSADGLDVKEVQNPSNPEAPGAASTVGPWKIGDVVMLLPTGHWTLTKGGSVQQQYTMVPFSNVESVYEGDVRNPITRAFRLWQQQFVSEEESDATNHTVQGSTYAALAKLLNDVFGAYYNFSVKNKKIDGLWNLVVERTTVKFYSTNNFAGDANRRGEENREGLRERLTKFGMPESDVETLLQGVLKAKNAEEARTLLSQVQLPEGVRFSYDKKNGTVTIGIVHSIYTGRVNSDTFVEDFAEAFTGERISVNTSLLNKTFDFLGKEVDYNQLVGGSLRANLSPGIARTVNSFFSLAAFNMDDTSGQPEIQSQPEQTEQVVSEPQEVSISAPALQQAATLSREDLVRELSKKMPVHGQDFFNIFGDLANDEELRRILLDSRNLAYINDIMEKFDEEFDDAEEVWSDVRAKGILIEPSNQTEAAPAEVAASVNENAEPVVDTEVIYTDKQGKKQTYTISGEVIRNKDGKEVFSKDTAQRRKILFLADMKNGRTMSVLDDSGMERYVTLRGEVFDALSGSERIADPKLLRKVFKTLYDKFGPEKTGVLLEKAYGWSTLDKTQKESFEAARKLTDIGLAEKLWESLSYEDRVNALACY